MLSIIYEDSALLVLNKTCSLHSVANPRSNGPSLAAEVIKEYPLLRSAAKREGDAGFISRLDFETSGIIVASKTREAWNKLRSEGEKGRIKKLYIALAEGEFPKRIIIDAPIGTRHRRGKKVRAFEGIPKKKDRAQDAETIFTRKKYFEDSDASLIEAEISLGKRHQIRAHASFAGHPLLGDSLYGSELSIEKVFSGSGIPQFFLHAARISFKHPVTGEDVEFVATVPSYAGSLLKDL